MTTDDEEPAYEITLALSIKPPDAHTIAVLGIVTVFTLSMHYSYYAHRETVLAAFIALIIVGGYSAFLVDKRKYEGESHDDADEAP